MNTGTGLIVFYGLPLVLVLSCVWAAFRFRRRRVRILALIPLLITCAAFAVWCAVVNLAFGAIAIAPAAAIAVMRLLLDGFSILAEHIEDRAEPGS